MNLKRFRPTPSMAVAMLALVVAIGGTAVAATKIGTKQIKNNAVTTKKIKKNAVTTNRIKTKAVTGGKLAGGAVSSGKLADAAVTGPKIAANAVDGSKVADDSIGDAKTSEYKTLGDGLVRVTATDGADTDTARAAAPETSLYEKGPLEIYAKCFRNAGTNTLKGAIYVRTATDFSILEGTDDLTGGPLPTDYLNVATLEVDRELDDETVGANNTDYGEDEGVVAAVGGPAIQVITGIGTKNGAVAADGPYGPGNACLFQGSVAG